eukprot:Nk52_evm14s272 gene=Nk52_evmTU14s272
MNTIRGVDCLFVHGIMGRDQEKQKQCTHMRFHKHKIMDTNAHQAASLALTSQAKDASRVKQQYVQNDFQFQGNNNLKCMRTYEKRVSTLSSGSDSSQATYVTDHEDISTVEKEHYREGDEGEDLEEESGCTDIEEEEEQEDIVRGTIIRNRITGVSRRANWGPGIGRVANGNRADHLHRTVGNKQMKATRRFALCCNSKKSVLAFKNYIVSSPSPTFTPFSSPSSSPSLSPSPPPSSLSQSNASELHLMSDVQSKIKSLNIL